MITLAPEHFDLPTRPLLFLDHLKASFLQPLFERRLLQDTQSTLRLPQTFSTFTDAEHIHLGHYLDTITIALS